jgi:hypothetical protein
VTYSHVAVYSYHNYCGHTGIVHDRSENTKDQIKRRAEYQNLKQNARTEVEMTPIVCRMSLTAKERRNEYNGVFAHDFGFRRIKKTTIM